MDEDRVNDDVLFDVDDTEHGKSKNTYMHGRRYRQNKRIAYI